MQVKKIGDKGLSFNKVIHDSFIGTTHQRNEDKVFVLSCEEYTILGVFDGVGSAKNNALATKIASQFIKRRHNRFYSNGVFRLEKMMLYFQGQI